MLFDSALEPLDQSDALSSLAYAGEGTVGAQLMQGRQHTLASPIVCTGVGVHSGAKVSMKILPAEEGAGITFFRTDLSNGARTIAARWDHVIDTRLCTVVGNDHGGRVATIEHLMAALGAAGIDNALIEIDGAEVPVMDGSANPFVLMIEETGLVAQGAPRRRIEVLKPVSIGTDARRATLSPEAGTRYSMDIAFDHAVISSQHYDFSLSFKGFKEEISQARTFGFFEDVEKMQKLGLMRGGSLDNAIVIKEGAIMNEGGLRYPNEFVRHKLLDAVGDMALAGGPILGHFEGVCSGHAMNNQLLRALFADPTAWRWAE